MSLEYLLDCETKTTVVHIATVFDCICNGRGEGASTIQSWMETSGLYGISSTRSDEA